MKRASELIKTQSAFKDRVEKNSKLASSYMKRATTQDDEKLAKFNEWSKAWHAKQKIKESMNRMKTDMDK